MKNNIIAIVYDFDGTLTPLPMQEYALFPMMGLNPEAFWEEVGREAAEKFADPMLVYMRLLIEKAAAKGISLTKKDFSKEADRIEYYQGVSDWFERMNRYVSEKSKGQVELRHYLISCGNREIITGTTIAKYFTKIYASSYHYNEKGNPDFPAVLITDTSKTQFLFRINKGREDIHESVNTHMPIEERPIPFQNILYIGDGLTDVPCMAVTRQCGGHAVAVYNQESKKAEKTCQTLLLDERADFIAAADYREKSCLSETLKTIMDLKISGIILENTRKELEDRINAVK